MSQEQRDSAPQLREWVRTIRPARSRSLSCRRGGQLSSFSARRHTFGCDWPRCAATAAAATFCLPVPRQSSSIAHPRHRHRSHHCLRRRQQRLRLRRRRHPRHQHPHSHHHHLCLLDPRRRRPFRRRNSTTVQTTSRHKTWRHETPSALTRPRPCTPISTARVLTARQQTIASASSPPAPALLRARLWTWRWWRSLSTRQTTFR